MSSMRDLFRHTLAASLLCLASTASAAVFEVPVNGGNASGVGYFSGWKCPPNDDISIVVDAGSPIPVPSRVRRNDTAGVCGNDGRNGYISQINFSLLGAGVHTATVRQGGVPFAQTTFSVATFGTNFLTGASATYVLNNFPSTGETATVEWVQGQQNFVIIETNGVGGEVAIRYANDLECNTSGFTSTLSANGYTWSAFTGNISPYQVVTGRSTLGPFVETNSTTCGDILYPFTLQIPSGRAYVLVQTFFDGGPFLAIEDEGPMTLMNSAPIPPPAAAAARGGAGVGAVDATGEFSVRAD